MHILDLINKNISLAYTFLSCSANPHYIFSQKKNNNANKNDEL